MKAGQQGPRSPYLVELPLDEALRAWFSELERQGALAGPPAEEVPVPQALGRVLASAAFARVSSPAYSACAMDGYAVRASETFGAGDGTPLGLSIPQQAQYVDTGDPLPEGFDAVIMIEDVQRLGGEAVEIRAAAVPWQHVRAVGEDVAGGELLLPSGWQLRGPDLAALTGAGVERVSVRRRPVVAVIPTGSELVSLAALSGRPPGRGQVVESNSLLVAGAAEAGGGEARVLPSVPDDPAAISEMLLRAVAGADAVVISAGSSAGSQDYTARVLGEVGEVAVHGVATRPGKPVVLGCCRGKAVIGMPGYPVSAWLALENFLGPLLRRMLGQAPPSRERLRARLSRAVPSPAGVLEYVRVKVGRVAGELVAAPLARGAGVLTSLVRADGLLLVPAGVEGYEAGTPVEVQLLRPREEIEGTVIAVGSHDLALDVLGDHLRRGRPGLGLSSVNAGSLGGLQALARGEAHLAGTHLLDETSGDYNVAFVRRLLPGRRVALFCLAHRQQGLLVARGNPLGIRGVADLARDGVRFVNRQRGAGTRILLDHLLRRAGLGPEKVQGYQREVYTHLAVAAEVAAGAADAGMGILAAAHAAGLGYVPLEAERYELAVPEETWAEPGVRSLLEVASSAEFRSAMRALQGYDLRDNGTVRWVEPEGAGA